MYAIPPLWDKKHIFYSILFYVWSEKYLQWLEMSLRCQKLYVELKIDVMDLKRVWAERRGE